MNFKVDLDALSSDINKIKTTRNSFDNTISSKLNVLNDASNGLFSSAVSSISSEVKDVLDGYDKITDFLLDFKTDLTSLENELNSEFSNLKELDETKDIIKALNVSKIKSASSGARNNANNAYANNQALYYNQYGNQLYNSLFDQGLDGSTLFRDAFPDLDISSFFEDLGIDFDDLDIDLSSIENMSLDDINNLVFNLTGVNGVGSIGSITSLNSNLGFNSINTNAISVEGINSLTGLASIGSAIAFDGVNSFDSINGFNGSINGINNGFMGINSIDSINSLEGITGTSIGSIDNSLLSIGNVGSINSNLSIGNVGVNGSNISSVGDLSLNGINSSINTNGINVNGVGDFNVNGINSNINGVGASVGSTSGVNSSANGFNISPHNLKVASASLVGGAIGVGGIAIASTMLHKGNSVGSSTVGLNGGVSEVKDNARPFFNSSVSGGSSAPNLGGEVRYSSEGFNNGATPYNLTTAYIPNYDKNIYSLVTLISNVNFITGNSRVYLDNKFKITNSLVSNSIKLDKDYHTSSYLEIIIYLDLIIKSLETNTSNNYFNNFTIEEINSYKDLLINSIDSSYLYNAMDDDITKYISKSFIYNFTASRIEDIKKINNLL